MNVEWLAHLPAPARRGLYFALQGLVGSRIRSIWKEFLSWERLSPVDLDLRVEKRLGRLLDGAVVRSPYYRHLGITRRPGESSKEFLARFPFLTREILRERFVDIVAEPLRAEVTSPDSVSSRGYRWIIVKTGGTTGNPTTVVHDQTQRDWGRATRLFSARQCGHPLGTRYFKLWGSEQDLLQTQMKFHLRVQRNLLGDLPLNAFRAKDPDLRRHHAILLAHPEIDSMMAYVDAAVSLALFIEAKDLPRPRLRTLMACAGTVTPEWREILERVFGAEVFNKYGSRECCDIACECPFHRGLHVNSPDVFLEVVDNLGAACHPGQAGRILVTMLNNAGFPMIRYQIGDIGCWEEPGICPCGCAWPRLRTVEGRADEMLLTEDGTLLSSVFVRHFVGVRLNRQIIREWQLEQTGRHEFIFRFVSTQKEGLEENLARIRESFLLTLGRSASIEMRRVPEIPPSASGKQRWIINRLSSPIADGSRGDYRRKPARSG